MTDERQESCTKVILLNKSVSATPGKCQEKEKSGSCGSVTGGTGGHP